MTDDSRKKLSERHKGKHFSPRTEFKKGMVWPERRRQVEVVCKTCAKVFSVKRCQAPKRKNCSMQCFSIYQGLKTKGRKIHTEEFRQKLRQRNWRGGVTPLNQLIRRSPAYKEWREAVFRRDNYQCVQGGQAHGNKLNADHIKPFSLFPELRFSLSNGRTLCVECHKRTDSYGWKGTRLNKIKA